jgi:heavy metal sensor kinase
VSSPDLPLGRTAARLRWPWGLPVLRGLSIRWRLTLWYTAIVSVTLIIFSLVVYWFARNSMMQELDRASAERASQVSDIVLRMVKAQNLLKDQYSEELMRLGIIDTTLDPFKDPGVGIRVRLYRRDRVVLVASPQLQNTTRIPDDRQYIRAAEHGSTSRAILLTAPDETFYVYTRPVNDALTGRLIAVVQIFTSIEGHQERLALLERMLMLGTLLGTLLALLLGAAIAEVILAPITAVTRTASQINRTQDLGRRIADTGHRDELGRLAITFNDMLDRIEAMFDRQRQLVADVSHELRTPLTTIRGEVELMTRRGALDPEGLAAVQHESARMSRLVNDLLLLAQADSGLAMDRYPVALEVLLADVLRQARNLAPGLDTVQLGDVVPVTVLGDADRLRQLLLNLVDNAFKHNPPGTTVTLSLAQSGSEALLRVADNGRGIPAEDLPHVFERFYRADKARSRTAGGTGLGLSIVKWIAVAHGGQMEVTSAPETGTCFTLHLPVAKDTELDD